MRLNSTSFSNNHWSFHGFLYIFNNYCWLNEHDIIYCKKVSYYIFSFIIHTLH